MAGRVRVYIACSFDGFVAGPDDDLEWLQPGAPVGETEAIEFDQFMAQIGAMLMGRRTYDVVASMGDWPYGETPVLVTTHRPIDGPTARTVRPVEGDIVTMLAEAKEVAGDRDVYVDGANLVQQALDARLVDELVVTFVPIVLGDGVRLFDGLTSRHLLRFETFHRYGEMLQVVAHPIRD